MATTALSATYLPTSLDGQNGWDGGVPCLTFVNNDPGDETVQAGVVHSGSQAWGYYRGYGSPGCGTPFSPQTASVGRPSSGSLGDVAIVRFAFKAVAPGDDSVQSIYLGSVNRDDRTGSHIVLRNEPAGVRLTMSTFSSNPPACDAFTTVDIATVSAGDWHTVRMCTQYHEDLALDVTHYVIDEGTSAEVTADLVAWPHPWRECNMLAYSPGASLKFANTSPDTTDYDGFYYDDVSLHVIDSSTNTTAGFFGTGFEPVETVVPPAGDLDGDPCDVGTGPPTSKRDCMRGGWRNYDTPREFESQGDCIQSVNSRRRSR